MIVFQCSMCGDTTKAELSAIPYSYAYGKEKPSEYNMATYPFTVNIPDGWMVAFINNEVVMICAFCPNEEQ